MDSHSTPQIRTALHKFLTLQKSGFNLLSHFRALSINVLGSLCARLTDDHVAFWYWLRHPARDWEVVDSNPG